MRCWIEIDAQALRHNYREFCRIAGRDRIVPVLKSNAYGHGLTEIYRCLAGESVSWLAVNYLEEVESLRALGFQGRALVVGPVAAESLQRAVDCGAEVVVGDDRLLTAWMQAVRRPRMHVKIDTGMSRQGFLPRESVRVAAALKTCSVDVVGICTHFANVEDVLEHEYADQQIARFFEARQAFDDQGYKLLAHTASSASCLLLEKTRLDLCRIGISLYGLWPSQATRLSYLQTHQSLAELKPALTWCSEISSVKPVDAGQYIGYGCTYRAVRPMNVAVVPVGYFEGFPRVAANAQAHVICRGVRCPVVGRICMNMMMADVSHLPEAVAGDRITLIGRDGGEVISAGDLAGWSGTIHYEIVTRLNPEIPRRLVNE